MPRTLIAVSIYGKRDTGQQQSYEDTVTLTPEQYARLLDIFRETIDKRRTSSRHMTKMLMPGFWFYANRYNQDVDILCKLDI
jgi:hypothetical protein